MDHSQYLQSCFTVHGDSVRRVAGIPGILPSMGLVQELVGVLASFWVDGEEAFIVLSVRVLDDCLQVFDPGRDGGGSWVEQNEKRIPFFLLFYASHAELGAFVCLNVYGLPHVMASQPQQYQYDEAEAEGRIEIMRVGGESGPGGCIDHIPLVFG